MKNNLLVHFLKETTIKTKLFVLALISIFGLFILCFLLIFTLETTQVLHEGQKEIKELHADLLTLRRHEKDFVQRRDTKYIAQFEQTMIYIHQDIERLNEILTQFHIDTKKIQKLATIIQTYKRLFLEFSNNKQLHNLKYDEGIHKEMRQYAHKAEQNIDNLSLTILIELDQHKQRLKFMAYSLFGIISLLVLLLSRFIIKTIVSNFEQKVNEQTKDLEKSLEQLKNMQTELIQNEKMASLGSLVAGVSHEINTPIGIALTASTHTKDELVLLEKSYLNETMSEKEFLSYIEDTKITNTAIQKNLKKAIELIKSFKQVSVDQMSDEQREFYLKEYIDEILLSLHNKIKKTNITFNIDIDKNLYIYSNAGAFSQIFTNLILNSIIHGFDNSSKQGIITITAHVKDNHLKITYEDNGKGLDNETKKKIFDPFYTTNRSNGGSGLGMNIVYNIITQKLNGSIIIVAKKEQGVKFAIECKIKSV